MKENPSGPVAGILERFAHINWELCAHLKMGWLKEGSVGEALLDTIEATPDDAASYNIHEYLDGHQTHLVPGEYKRLFVGDTLMMSDTPDEVLDHLDVGREFDEGIDDLVHTGRPPESVLILGLGLGVVTTAALEAGVENVTVVELSQDVIELVGSQISERYGSERVRFICDDALTIKWPPRTKFDVIWADIWPTIDPDNLPEYATCGRRYRPRARQYYGAWRLDYLLAIRQRERREERKLGQLLGLNRDSSGDWIITPEAVKRFEDIPRSKPSDWIDLSFTGDMENVAPEEAETGG